MLNSKSLNLSKKKIFAIVFFSTATFFTTIGFGLPLYCFDVLTFTNGGVYGVGVMVDGSITGISPPGPPENDKPAAGSSLSPMILWGDFIPSTDPLKAGNEIIAFSQGRGPTLIENVPWSPGTQIIPVTLDSPYMLNVAVRIVGEPSTFTAKSNRASRACYDANRFWGEEGRGIIVICSLHEDKTVMGSSIVSFTCGNEGDPTRTFIQSAGFTQNQINVYYVDIVESEVASGGSGTAYGAHCPEYPNVIAMGSMTDGNLLAHEIGHALSLDDIDCLSSSFPPSACTSNHVHFDTTEIMHSASNQRRYLTEGEVFRTVFSTASWINDATYGLRGSSLTTRNCNALDDSTSDPICPAIQKRIWPDGVGFPQN